MHQVVLAVGSKVNSGIPKGSPAERADTTAPHGLPLSPVVRQGGAGTPLVWPKNGFLMRVDFQRAATYTALEDSRGRPATFGVRAKIPCSDY